MPCVELWPKPCFDLYELYQRRISGLWIRLMTAAEHFRNAMTRCCSRNQWLYCKWRILLDYERYDVHPSWIDPASLDTWACLQAASRRWVGENHANIRDPFDFSFKVLHNSLSHIMWSETVSQSGLSMPVDHQSTRFIEGHRGRQQPNSTHSAISNQQSTTISLP